MAKRVVLPALFLVTFISGGCLPPPGPSKRPATLNSSRSIPRPPCSPTFSSRQSNKLAHKGAAAGFLAEFPRWRQAPRKITP